MSGEKPLPPALELRGVRFVYTHDAPVLSDLDLVVDPGERVGVIGPNGAGKTTLFHLISGLLVPKAGQIAVHGRPVRPGRFNPEVGLVFQEPDDQLFCPSVHEDVAFGPSNMGLPPEQVQHRVAEALAKVGASALAQRPVQHLSGGEKRVVCLAGVLAMQPRLIIFDEPSAGLDLRNRRRLLNLLQGLEQTLLIASHDLELLLEACTRVILLDQGRVVADGPIRTIMGNAELMLAHGQEKPHSLYPHRHEPDLQNYAQHPHRHKSE